MKKCLTYHPPTSDIEPLLNWLIPFLLSMQLTRKYLQGTLCFTLI
jgi:hypothetical protein